MPIGEAQSTLLKHVPALRAHIQHRIPNRLRRVIDVDDVLQEVFEQVLRRHGPNNFSEIHNMAPYLKCAASSVLIGALRAHGTKKRGGHPDGAQICHPNDFLTSCLNLFDQFAGRRRTPSSEAAVREAVQCVQSALERIPEDQRKAVRLYHLEGLSYDEVGQQMGRSHRSIHGLMQRGRSALRSELRSAARFLSDAATDSD